MTQMTLTEKVKTLFDICSPYVNKFSYGVVFPFAIKTSWRKGLEPDLDLLHFYKNRSGFSDDVNFRDYFKASGRRDLAYPVGMAVGLLGIVAGLLEYSEVHNNTAIIVATLGALTAGNAASILYEKRRVSKNGDEIAT